MKYARYLCTSVDDLRSTLGCELSATKAAEAPAAVEKWRKVLEGVPKLMKTRRGVIETHIRKLRKLGKGNG